MTRPRDNWWMPLAVIAAVLIASIGQHYWRLL